MRSTAAIYVACISAVLGACGDEEIILPTPASCTTIGGTCVGVPAHAVCDADPCTDGVACARVIPAKSDAELGAALASAAAGDCISLSPGGYGAAAVPPGVSLLGRSAEEVSVASITLGSGEGATVRGLAVTDGFDAGSATGVVVAAVRIRGGGFGLRAGNGASVDVIDSEIQGATNYGVLGVAPASVTLERVIVDETAVGGGIWVTCDPVGDPCACAQKPELSLDHVLLRKNHYVSISLQGTIASLRSVVVHDTLIGPSFKAGGGVAAAACSSVDADGLEVAGAFESDDPQNHGDPIGFGVLVDGSSATLGHGEAHGIIIIDGKPGLWLQRVGAPVQEPEQQVVLDGVSIQSAYGTGIGVDLEAHGIIIIDGRIADTQRAHIPVEPTGSLADVGLGLAWKAGSSVTIDALDVESSAGLGVLIDGPAGPGSAIHGLTLGGGDEIEGVVQQNVSDADPAPATDQGVAVQRQLGQVTDVPQGPKVPASAP